jgi:uncharacterized protein YndB with AHSA1/START domain
MPDITHQFPIRAPIREVFDAVSTPQGLDAWWSLKCSGEPKDGAEYQFNFGPGYDWRATVSRYKPDNEFELRLTAADNDWLGTRVTFLLAEKDGMTEVRFQHTGWPIANEHHNISCFCSAMYLRLLKRYVEFGEVVRYEDRLDV